MDTPRTNPQVGVGLRPTHYPFLQEKPEVRVQWFEAISENYMDSEGRPIDMLELVRADYPVALHGVSLSIVSAEGIRHDYLAKLKILIDRINPFIVSDHLCWTGHQAANLHDLLPFPFTEDALRVIQDNVDHVQNYLKRHILLENVSTYLSFPQSQHTEWEFLTIVSNTTGCKLLLDVNNLYVNSQNHHFDPLRFVDAIPTDLIGQIHLAGYTDMGTYLFDTHSNPVSTEVWNLFSHVIARAPDVPVLIEWDDDIPEFPRLEEEALKAAAIWENHHGPVDAQALSTII
ncbi:DUF692 domain-containing protein [Candidatus Nitronereus thalassa]|uniref:DUF692 domain-containing protein n=1 Tax=Candidatus Nitronereus thalassa TaxID=3020898 RepID=A0ABU3KCQ2_9BACT|nr:DUF692 domain-containing protein [Candidatus Nitronereus thalassa]MDT7044042.1 DUF692 domain-containing protein [Candidatus Nitronereus thalassa]